MSCISSLYWLRAICPLNLDFLSLVIISSVNLITSVNPDSRHAVDLFVYPITVVAVLHRLPASDKLISRPCQYDTQRDIFSSKCPLVSNKIRFGSKAENSLLHRFLKLSLHLTLSELADTVSRVLYMHLVLYWHMPGPMCVARPTKYVYACASAF